LHSLVHLLYYHTYLYQGPVAKNVESDESSEENSGSQSGLESDSSSEEESDKEDSEDQPQPKKRKAEETIAAPIKKTKTELDENTETSKNLFVGNLSWNVDEEWLRGEFEEFGELTGVRIVADKQTGRSKG
jgi:nucleolin